LTSVLQTFWNSSDRRSERAENHKDRQYCQYKHTKWSRWCITASLDYKNTMINRITMETVAWLRSNCHLKQNLIPRWSFRHTCCISDYRWKTKYTNKKCCRILGPAYLAVLPVLVIFCPLAPTVRRISKSLQYTGQKIKC
jgi:hypothetical protein